MTTAKTVLVASAVSAFALSLAATAEAATVTLDFDDPVPAPFVLDPDSPGIVNGNCLADPCLGVNSEGEASLTTEGDVPFSVSTFWFELLGAQTSLFVTTSAGQLVLDAATWGHNDGGQFIDVSGEAIFQNITSLSFLTDIGNARVDDVGVSPVPLPAPALLLLAGLGGLAALRRRSRAA